jgi:uncharacterized membrane protein YeaQ/YmgE (transglycosylase-associated protein family)
MDVIVWIIFGALAGWVASAITGTDVQQGALGNILVGIVGALVGGYTMNIFGYGGVSGFNAYSMFVAVLGAVISLWIYKMYAIRAS